MEKLREMLKISEDGLMPDEHKKVRDFVLEAHDVGGFLFCSDRRSKSL